MTFRANITEDEPRSTAPAWMVTWGDMMSLILCFFIMLVAMSEIKDEKFQRILDSFKKAFGYTAGVEVAPGIDRTTSIWERLQMPHAPRGYRDAQGGLEIMTVRGQEFLCRTVRQGRMITVGDKVTFAAGSAELPAAVRDELDVIVELVGDYANRLLVCGHASAREETEGMSPWELSFRRAAAVAEHLMEKGINPRRLMVQASGRFDPVEKNLTPQGRERNRRVEIVVSTELVQNADPGRSSDE